MTSEAKTTDGATIGFELYGEGPNRVVLLFRHQPWKDWGYFGAFPECTFLIVDPRGHGQSSFFHDRNRYGLWKIADDVLAATDAAGFDDFIACGYSQGALRMGALAARTDRVKALICGGFAMLDLSIAPEHFSRMEADAAKGYGSYEDGAPFDWSESFVLFTDAAKWDSERDLAAVDCPKLLYYGSQDVFAPPIRERIPRLRRCGFEVLEVPELDHDTAAMRIDVVAPSIRQFLSRSGVLLEGTD